MAYLSDHSPTAVGPGPDGQGERHEAVMDLAEGVDLLIHDAQHLASQFPGVGFLGHASVEYNVALAREAGVRTLALFHHAPSRTDDEVDAIELMARELAGDDARRPSQHTRGWSWTCPLPPRADEEGAACRSTCTSCSSESPGRGEVLPRVRDPVR